MTGANFYIYNYNKSYMFNNQNVASFWESLTILYIHQVLFTICSDRKRMLCILRLVRDLVKEYKDICVGIVGAIK